MTTQLAPVPMFRGWDNNGNPLAGGQLFTYAAGTSTAQATYVDSTQTTQNTNPVILNARGEAPVWLDPTLTYKLVLQDSLGNQIWSQDQIVGGYVPVSQLSTYITAGFIGQLIYPRTAAEIAANITPTSYVYPPGQFERYGAVGDNSTDDSAAVVTATKSGALVTAIAGKTYYCGSGTLNLTTSFEASLYGVALRTAVVGVTFLNITASNVEIRGLEVYGRGNSSYVAAEHLIDWNGTSDHVNPPNYLTDLRLTDCYLHDVGERALYSQFGQRAVLTNCRFKNIGYAAVQALSGLDWEILGGIIDTVGPGTSGNAYGVSFTRDPTVSDNLTIIPRAKNCKVVGMTVKNNTVWTALDTHGGEECVFSSNIIENCKMAVTIGSCPGVSTNPLFGPKNCKSIGNTATNPSPISGNFGVGISGAIVNTGTIIDAAEGCASIGDKVTGFGITNNGTTGGFLFFATSGLVVSACQANQCFPNGFSFYHDNLGFTISGCEAIDPYDNVTTNPSGIMLNAGFNTGTISGNSFLRNNSGLATFVGVYALNMVVSTSSSLAVGANYSTMTNYQQGIPNFSLTALTDNSGGTAGSTIAAVPASYNQSTLANQLASLASAINKVETALRTAGMMT